MVDAGDDERSLNTDHSGSSRESDDDEVDSISLSSSYDDDDSGDGVSNKEYHDSEEDDSVRSSSDNGSSSSYSTDGYHDDDDDENDDNNSSSSSASSTDTTTNLVRSLRRHFESPSAQRWHTPNDVTTFQNLRQWLHVVGETSETPPLPPLLTNNKNNTTELEVESSPPRPQLAPSPASAAASYDSSSSVSLSSSPSPPVLPQHVGIDGNDDITSSSPTAAKVMTPIEVVIEPQQDGPVCKDTSKQNYNYHYHHHQQQQQPETFRHRRSRQGQQQKENIVPGENVDQVEQSKVIRRRHRPPVDGRREDLLEESVRTIKRSNIEKITKPHNISSKRDSNNNSSTRKRKKKRHRRSSNDRCCNNIHWSTIVLGSSFMVWLYFQMMTILMSPTTTILPTDMTTMTMMMPIIMSRDMSLTTTGRHPNPNNNHSHRRRVGGIPSDKHSTMMDPQHDDQVLKSNDGVGKRRNNNQKKKPDREMISPDCELVEWQRRPNKSQQISWTEWIVQKDDKQKKNKASTTTTTTSSDRMGTTMMKNDDSGPHDEMAQQTSPVELSSSSSSTTTTSSITTTILNCNMLHEMDLNHLMTTKSDMDPTGGGQYLSSGLWRDVWRIPDGSPPRPRLSTAVTTTANSTTIHHNGINTISSTGNSGAGVVLKMMKTEHDLTLRNYDRHRREAMVMERLTSSPYIVDLFGYCGNTIVTEYAPLGPVQDKVLRNPSKTKNKNGKRRRRRPPPPPPHILPRPSIGMKPSITKTDADYDVDSEYETTTDDDDDDKRSNGASDTDTAGDDRDGDEQQQRRSQRQQRDLKSSSSSLRGSGLRARQTDSEIMDDTMISVGSKHTFQALSEGERLQLMLHAAKAVEVLHAHDVIHADLTGQQFLLVVSNSVMDSNVVAQSEQQQQSYSLKLNDFNRCRFVPHRKSVVVVNSTSPLQHSLPDIINNNNHDDARCTIQIPSAPGLYRSPEEYADKPLTRQLDVFSLGHVLVEIWYGVSPWEDVGGRRIRDMVQDGVLPPMLQHILQPQPQTPHGPASPSSSNSSSSKMDYEVAQLISNCYIVDPSKRITALQLVKELEKMILKVK